MPMTFTKAQGEAIESSGNVLVVAGAGTGKTRTLVERLGKRLLDSQSPLGIDQVLVVTFTEAAAAEVRDRILRLLERELAAGDHADQARRQLALLDSAHISTLHGFCHQLVRRHFHQLGLDPLASIMDVGRKRVLMSESFRETLDRHHRGEAENSTQVIDLLNTYFKGDEQLLSGAVWRAHDFLQSLADPAGCLADETRHWNFPTPARWERQMLEDARDWRDQWRKRIATLPANHINRDVIAHILSMDLADTGSLGEMVAALEALEWPKGAKETYHKPIKSLFEEAKRFGAYVGADGPRALAEDWDWARASMLPFLSLVGELGGCFAAAKREKGLLDFADLEQHAIALLWDPATGQPSELAHAWRRQFEWVFVDEYQDINGAQDRILRALSREGDRANRFLVGDMKQSIYRFRQSDPTIFRQYASDWGEGGDLGKLIFLSENFRSHAGVLQFVNQFFSRVMRGGHAEIEYDANAALAFGAAEDRAHFALREEAEPVVELLFGVGGEDSAAAGEEDEGSGGNLELQACEREAWMIGQRLQRFVEGQELIWDEVEGRQRPARWGDMVVLARASRSRAAHFAKVFSGLGIPILTKQDDFFDAVEIRDLRALLEILDNPLQDIPLLTVMRSPLAGFNHDELAKMRLAQRKGRFWKAIARYLDWGGESADTQLRERLRSFQQQYLEWRNSARRESLADRLESILAETRYLEWAAAQPRGRQKLANIREFIRVTREHDERGSGGLGGFLSHLKELIDGDQPSEPTAPDNTDAVRFMSIHQSKGLEFPIVVVANLERRFRSTDGAEDILPDRVWGLCPKIRPSGKAVFYPSVAHWASARAAGMKDIAEEMRILYVATTRAQSRLILSAVCDREKWSNRINEGSAASGLSSKSCMDWIGQVLTERHPGWISHDQGKHAEFSWKFIPLPKDAAGSAGMDHDSSILASEPESALRDLAQRLSFIYPHDAATRQFAKTSVSLLRKGLIEAEESAEWFKPRGHGGSPSDAMEYGSSHHRFLEHCRIGGLSKPEAALAEAERLRAGGFLSQRDLELLNPQAIADFWSSPLGVELVENAAHLQREVPFTFRLALADLPRAQQALLQGLPPDEFIVAQGVADLIVLKPEEIWLVDYKTDRVAPGEAHLIAAKYRPQLELYSLALSRIHKRPVTRRLLWLLGSAIAVEA